MTKASPLGFGLLVVLCAAVTLLYFPVWHGQFLYDDLWYIVQNPFVHRPLAFIPLFADARTVAAPQSGLSTDVYRPLTTLWFWIDSHLWGPNTFPYHVENLLLHIVNGLLLFTLLRRWTENFWGALAGCAVFLLHPVQVQSVAWITQRSTLAATACLLTALLFLIGRPEPLRRSWLLGIAAATAALFFRETSIVLPLLAGIVLLGQNRRPWIIVLVLVGVSVVYLGTRQAVLHQWSQVPQPSESWIANAALGILAFPVYLAKIIIPVKLRVSYAYPAVTLVRVGLSLLVWLLYAVSVFYVGRKDRWMAAGLLWIWIGLLPVLQIVPIRAFVAERFLYLPMIGVAVIVCRSVSRLAGPWLYVPWLFFLTVMTCKTAPDWKNEQSLWAEAVAQDPGNAFAHLCYGAALGDSDAAIEQYRQTLACHPNADQHFIAVNNLSNVLLHQGKKREALFWARKAIDQNPESPEALYNMTQAENR